MLLMLKIHSHYKILKKSSTTNPFEFLVTLRFRAIAFFQHGQRVEAILKGRGGNIIRQLVSGFRKPVCHLGNLLLTRGLYLTLHTVQ